MATYIVVGVFTPKEGDQNVIFKIRDIKDSSKDDEILMISAEYILEHFKNS